MGHFNVELGSRPLVPYFVRNVLNVTVKSSLSDCSFFVKRYIMRSMITLLTVLLILAVGLVLGTLYIHFLSRHRVRVFSELAEKYNLTHITKKFTLFSIYDNDSNFLKGNVKNHSVEIFDYWSVGGGPRIRPFDYKRMLDRTHVRIDGKDIFSSQKEKTLKLQSKLSLRYLLNPFTFLSRKELEEILDKHVV